MMDEQPHDEIAPSIAGVPIIYNVWTLRQFEEQPVLVQQIDDIVYLRRDIIQTETGWAGYEKIMHLQDYLRDTELARRIEEARAEAIVTAAEYAAIIAGVGR